jgi:hypothetical protein
VSLPDRTLCWVEGPPWDRACDPVDDLLGDPGFHGEGFDKALLCRRLADLNNRQLGSVLAILAMAMLDRGADPRVVFDGVVQAIDGEDDIREDIERALKEGRS